MTFLPIVERELRVAARKGATYWSRLGAGAVAFAVAGCIISLQELSDGSSFGNNFGGVLFAILSWLAFGGCCLAGIFFTSDSISEEKREGTLGLLFLTDLRGYDVVLGKLLATSLRASYAMLAIFPILALPLLLGGVTGLQFYKSLLALLNILFFSLALGVVVSAVQRDAQQSIKLTMLLLVALLAIPLMVDSFNTVGQKLPFAPFYSVISPAWAFTQASGGTGLYWESLAASHFLAWIFLAFAAWITPKVWQEKASAQKVARAQTWKFGAANSREKLRRQWLEKNPVCWLAIRQRWQGFLFKVIFLLSLGAFVFLAKLNEEGGGLLLNWTLSPFLHLLINIWLATQASRFFVEARQNGALELVLCTPVTGEEIVRGQCRALMRTFAFPVVLLASLQIAITLLQANDVASIFGSGGGPAANNPGWFRNYAVIQTLGALLSFVTGCFALGWFGMWAGLTSTKPSAAALKAFAFVVILPTLTIYMAQGFFMVGMGIWASQAGFQMDHWLIWQTVFSTTLAVAADIAFIAWSRRRLFSQVRAIAAGETVPSVRWRRKPEAEPAGTPPMIPK